MRTFVAIDLPEMVCRALADIQGQLRTGRLVPEENLHLTLAFLGQTDEMQLEEVHHALSALRVGGIEIGIGGIDLFGDIARPRLVVALVPDSPALSELQRRVEQAARKAGIDISRRRFRPHVTLARFGKSAPADTDALTGFLADFCGFSMPAVPARSMGLYASTLRPEGAQYEALTTYPLS